MSRTVVIRLIFACLIVAIATVGGVVAALPSKSSPTGSSSSSTPLPDYLQVTLPAPAGSPTKPGRVVPRSSTVRIFPAGTELNEGSSPSASSPVRRWNEYQQSGQPLPSGWAIPSATAGWSYLWLLDGSGTELTTDKMEQDETSRFYVRTQDVKLHSKPLTWTAPADDQPVPVGYFGPVKATYPLSLYSAAPSPLRTSLPVSVSESWKPAGYPNAPVARPTDTNTMIQAGCYFMWVYPSANPDFVIGHCPLLGGRTYAVERSKLLAYPAALASGWCAPRSADAQQWSCNDRTGSIPTSSYRGWARARSVGLIPVYGGSPKTGLSSPPVATPDGPTTAFAPFHDALVPLSDSDTVQIVGAVGTDRVSIQTWSANRLVVPRASLETTDRGPACYYQYDQFPCWRLVGLPNRHGRIR